ncbi:MAG: O-methyltransferase [Lachnospiraceae bacterium]|nr:O-methyltransferase [Lachnospiraceae bacterium]
MNVDERTIDYIDYLSWSLPEYLNKIYEDAMAAKVPVIRKSSQSFLKTMLTIKKPVEILEVGTAIGFSSMFMSEYMPEGAHITTIELIEARIKEARENFKRFEKEDKIKLIEGDAGEVLKKLSGEEERFDFIFLDAAQAQYISYLPYIIKLMKPEAVLITDNVMHDGDIVNLRYYVNRRDRTVHSRMREYLYEITHSNELTTTILPIGDGMSLSVRN